MSSSIILLFNTFFSFLGLSIFFLFLFASDIFKRLGYLSPEKVIEERLAAFTRVPELLDVEQVMKAAMEFRSERPWMAANPAADLTWLEELLEKGFIVKEISPANKSKFLYYPTQKGVDLVPLLFQLADWSKKHYAGCRPNMAVGAFRDPKGKAMRELRKRMRN